MRPPALGKLDECGADLFRAFLPQRPLSFVREARVSNAVTTQRGGQRARRASPLQNRLAIRSIRALTPSSSVAANQAPVAERPGAPACMAMGAHLEKPDLVLGNRVRRSDSCVLYGSNARRGGSKLDEPGVQGCKPAL